MQLHVKLLFCHKLFTHQMFFFLDLGALLLDVLKGQTIETDSGFKTATGIHLYSIRGHTVLY